LGVRYCKKINGVIWRLAGRSDEIFDGFDIEFHSDSHCFNFFIEDIIAPATRNGDDIGSILANIASIIFSVGVDDDVLRSAIFAYILDVSI
jgi:hypothetical protein